MYSGREKLSRRIQNAEIERENQSERKPRERERKNLERENLVRKANSEKEGKPGKREVEEWAWRKRERTTQHPRGFHLRQIFHAHTNIKGEISVLKSLNS